VNTGHIVAATANDLPSTCSVGRGGEHVWHYTPTNPAAPVIAVARAVDVTIDVELFALDRCGDDSDELACSGELGSDTIVIDVPAGADSVDIVVDSFVSRSDGRYTLTIGEATVVGEGDACDDFAVCGDGLTCVDSICLDSTEAFCAAEADIDAGLFTVDAVGVTSAPTCGGLGSADRAATAIRHTMRNSGLLSLRSQDFASFVVERRSACGDATVVACEVIGQFGNAEFEANAGDVVHLAVFGDGRLELQEVVTLPAGSRCAPGNANAVCAEPTECLGTPGRETCTTATDIPLGDSCDPDDTRDRCIDGQCLFDGIGAFSCIDPLAEFCTAEAVTAGPTTQTLPQTNDVFNPTCGGFGGRDKVFTYVAVSDSRVVITPDSNTTISILASACNEQFTETCSSGASGDPPARTQRLQPGDVVTFVASAQQTASFTLVEEPITVLQSGATCDPTSETELCPINNECLGGPSPRGFTCTTAQLADEGDACRLGSTDQVCARGLSCTNDVCVVDQGETEGELTGTLTPEETSFARVGNGCRREGDGRLKVNRFTVTNTTSQPTAVTFTTDGGNDTVMAVYIPEFNPSNPVEACLVSNDDIVNGNFNSAVNFNLAAGGTAEIAVWGFDPTAVFSFTLQYTSTQPIVVERR
jgi:hypothetical protein